MEKIHNRKKECSAKGCRKTAIDEGKCRLHATVKDIAVTEKVVSGHRIQSTAKKINKVRKTNKLQENSFRAPVAARRKDGYRAIFFKAGKILGGVGSFLEGK